MPTNFLVTTATPTTPSSTYHIPEKTTVSTPLTDPASFGTYIQSLRSVNHPIHRIPKAAHPSFASGLSKLFNKAISSNSPFDWHRLVCFSLSVLLSGPQSQGVSLTSSIKSRINTYSTLNQLACLSLKLLRQATPPPTTTHNDPAKNMKRLVNQKLSDFNVKGTLQTLSDNCSFANPNEESFNTLQQKHPQAPDDLKPPPPPDADTSPICYSTAQIRAAISSFPHGSGAGLDGLRPQHLKDYISITAGDASTSLLISLKELVNYLANGHLLTDLRPFLYGAQLHGLCKSNGDLKPIAVGCTYQRLVAKSLLESLHSKAP